MLKNFFMVLVLGLLQFQQSLAGDRIEILANGQTKPFTGTLDRPRITLDNANDRLPVGMMFRHRFIPEQSETMKEPWGEAPLRIVVVYPVEGAPVFEYKELQVIVKTVVGEEEIAKGSLLAWEMNNWTLRFSYTDTPTVGAAPTVKDAATLPHLIRLKNRFVQGETFHPVAQGFQLLDSDKFSGSVEAREIGLTRSNKLVLIVRFATSKASTVRKNGTTVDYDVYHIPGLYSDTGRLVWNQGTQLGNFELGGLIQYTSKANPDNRAPRDIDESPLREITAMEGGFNGLVFGKSLVSIQLNNGTTQEARLFAANSAQTQITAEIKFVEGIPDNFEDNYIKAGSTCLITPTTKGLKAPDTYRANKITENRGTAPTKKTSVEIQFVKVD